MTTESEKQEALRQARKNLEIRFDERDSCDAVIERHHERQRRAETKAADAESGREWSKWVQREISTAVASNDETWVETVGEIVADMRSEIAQQVAVLRSDLEVRLAKFDAAVARKDAEIAGLRLELSELRNDRRLLDATPLPAMRSVN
jgi:hypothetical protein